MDDCAQVLTAKNEARIRSLERLKRPEKRALWDAAKRGKACLQEKKA